MFVVQIQSLGQGQDPILGPGLTGIKRKEDTPLVVIQVTQRIDLEVIRGDILPRKVLVIQELTLDATQEVILEAAQEVLDRRESILPQTTVLEVGQDLDQELGQDLDQEPGQDLQQEPGQDLDQEPDQGQKAGQNQEVGQDQSQEADQNIEKDHTIVILVKILSMKILIGLIADLVENIKSIKNTKNQNIESTQKVNIGQENRVSQHQMMKRIVIMNTKIQTKLQGKKVVIQIVKYM